MKFEVIMEVKMTMLGLWVVMPCGLVAGHQRFGGTHYLHLQDSSETLVSTYKSIPRKNPKDQHKNVNVRVG
jgi:hypothetical protein